MADFKPDFPYNVEIELLIPTSYENVKGVRKPIYPEKGELIFCSFRTFGGTETTKNNVYSVLDTATVETWFRPDIQSNCRIKVLRSGAIYEIINEPENVKMRNQWCIFKVQRVKGGA